MSQRVVVVTADQTVVRKLAAALQSQGGSVEATGSLPEASDAATPVAVVVDLDRPDALDTARAIRERWPHALAAAFITTPDRARWDEAAQVFDLVATRGAIASQLVRRLETWTGPRRGTRIRLFEEADAAGRLGVVHRGETPAGPIAVYHVGRELFAVGDACPHAGARLSEGTLSGSVITCPRHGSQFDIRDGSRVRGPADEAIVSLPVSVEDGIVYLEFDREP
ncbi:MAG: Rieske (2Fe-2S) protein [Actinomycetota bacterium]